MTDTAYLPVEIDDDTIDCTVMYEVIGFYLINLLSVKIDGDDRPELLDVLDKDTKYNIEADIVRRLEWKKEPKYRGDNL